MTNVGVRALFPNSALLAMLVAACGTEPPCKPTSALVVIIVRSDLETASVETEGACTQVMCVREAGAGCREWDGQMTSKDPGDECIVRLVLPDGRKVGPARAPAGESCGVPMPGEVTF